VLTLGLDIGGVLVDRAFHETDTSFFGGDPMGAPPVTVMLEELPAVAARFEHRVHLVSKAGPTIARVTREWLEHLGFFAVTGIARHHVHFVSKRSEKAAVCERLGITHFVDDRNDVLESLDGVVAERYLFLGGGGVDVAGPGIHEATGWVDLGLTLRAGLPPG